MTSLHAPATENTSGFDHVSRRPENPAHLFSPITLRAISLRNRIVVSPMCQYSCEARDGMADDWHLVHLGSFATGGASLVFTEAAAVEERGRISAQDLGIWNDAQIEPLSRITRFLSAQGAVPGIQLAHAGRKASVHQPWTGGGPLGTNEGAWQVVGPSEVPFSHGYPSPHALTSDELDDVVNAFVRAAERALAAGFQVAELHAAHGYLLHQFLSPVSNQRKDQFGGTFANRIRFPLSVVRAVRRVWPEQLPLFVRISSTDWLPDGEGWDLEQSIAFCRELAREGVDVIDCSSGGNVAGVRIPVGSGYQVPFAAAIRREAGVRTMAVGLITSPEQADQIIRSDQADMVALAREELRNPHWPLLAARALHQPGPWPLQYERASN